MDWPTSNFPTSLDTITDKVDLVDDIMAADINGAYDAIEKIEAKVGVNSSAVATSLDYKVTNASSSNPGHKHTVANGATDVTASAAEINVLDDVVAGTTTANKALVVGASKQLNELTVTALTATLTGNVTGNVTGDVSGNATTATNLVGLVSQAKLKTSTGEVSVTIYKTGTQAAEVTLPGGSYGFFPQTKAINGSIHGATCEHSGYPYIHTSAAGETGTYNTNFFLSVGPPSNTTSDADYYTYAQQRYVASSGELNWLFFLRDKTTKKVKASWFGSDHPCFGSGGDPEVVYSPFDGYNTSVDEVVCITLTDEELADVKVKASKGESILQVLNTKYIIDDEEEVKVANFGLITVGLPEGHDWKMQAAGTAVEPIRKIVKSHKQLLYRRLKLK